MLFRLGDSVEVARVGADCVGELRPLRGRAHRTHQHPVAARRPGPFHHQRLEVRQDVLPLRIDRAVEGRDVGEHRLLAQIVADHRRNVRIDRLVVGDAGADRVRQRHVAGAIGIEQAGDAERGVGAEIERVDEVVVDPAVDHVDPARPARRLHVDEVVAHDEVVALDEFDAHAAREQRVLEVGAVVDPRGEDRDRRLADVRRRGGDERVEQPARIVFDRERIVLVEQPREGALEDVAVLEDVRDPRGRAAVVFEDQKRSFVVADQIDPRDVDVRVTRRADPDRLAFEVLRGVDQRARDDPVAQDATLAVDVEQEVVERADALSDAARDARPIGGGDDARDQVEREDALRAARVGVDREGDAALQEDRVDGRDAMTEVGRRDRRERRGEGGIVGSRHSVGVGKLVVGRRRSVPVEDRAHSPRFRLHPALPFATWPAPSAPSLPPVVWA